MIKTIWFDLGNVILPFDFTPAFRRLSRFGHFKPQRFRKFFKDRPHLLVDSDEGRIHSYQLYRLIKSSFNLNGCHYHEFKTIWNDIFKENRSVISLIHRLKKKGYRLILISNTNKLHFDHLWESYPVLHKFNRHILSFKIKKRKPKRAIYKAALRVSRALPHEIFYTDDIPSMARAATKHAGVVSHTFKNMRGLTTALKKAGVQA